MAGKTISMHASGETAQRLEYIARVEDRTSSQIASAALSFYLQLPPEAHTALRHVQVLGDEADASRVMRDIARLLLNAQYDVAVRQMGKTLEGRPVPESEDEMLAEAELLLSGQVPEIALSVREQVPSRA